MKDIDALAFPGFASTSGHGSAKRNAEGEWEYYEQGSYAGGLTKEQQEELDRLIRDFLDGTRAPSSTSSAPVDPESEAANPVWDLVITKCHSAYPERQGMSWNESPLELITEIINDRDEAKSTLNNYRLRYGPI